MTSTYRGFLKEDKDGLFKVVAGKIAPESLQNDCIDTVLLTEAFEHVPGPGSEFQKKLPARTSADMGNHN